MELLSKYPWGKIMKCKLCNHRNIIFQNEFAYAAYHHSIYPRSIIITTKRHVVSYNQLSVHEIEAILELFNDCNVYFLRKHIVNKYNINIISAEFTGNTEAHLYILLIPF